MFSLPYRTYDFCYIWLKRNIELAHFFYCCTCQNPVFRYQGQVVAIIPAGVNAMNTALDSVMNFPFEQKCTNKNCPAKYVVEGTVL